MAEGKCEPTSGNILPVDLDQSNMRNSSGQLTHFIYDFTPCNNFNLSIECPSWLNRLVSGGCTTGAIKIEQSRDNSETDLLNFVTIGKLTGNGQTNNRIVCYYFPKRSLNLYDGEEPSGGEMCIELVEKRGTKGNGEKKRLLLFIPVEIDDKPSKSNNWFKGIYPNALLSKQPGSHSTRGLSLNQLIPKSSFWVYNDIKFHGEEPCGANGGGKPKEFKETHAIFFVDEYLKINRTLHQGFVQCSSGGTDCLNQIDLSNNTVDWKEIWYPTSTISQTIHTDVNADTDGICSNPDKTDDSGCKNNTTDGKMKYSVCEALENDDGGPCEFTVEGSKGKDMSKRHFEAHKVKTGSIFKNELGTTLGPGLHNKGGDPFSLTCEPIVDEDDKPIEGKDRLEWIKGVYNSVPKGAAQMIWIFVFVIILTGILMALHIFIFKNIGLFITQNEIISRVDK
jgi:hypothetical protein